MRERLYTYVNANHLEISKRDIIIYPERGHFFSCGEFIIPQGSKIYFKEVYRDNKDPFIEIIYDYEIWEYNGHKIPFEYINSENFYTLQEYREEILNKIIIMNE